MDVAEYMGSRETCHPLRFLNEEESWNLFHQTVFGEEKFPPELLDVGMDIAYNCQGLPLSIVVIGGLLLKVHAKDYREYVAVNLSSIIVEKDDHCSHIFALSYNNLPSHLKPCFLYMGIFPQNYEIPVSRLVKLWVAEGFVNLDISQNQEKAAQKYLIELIGKNLILVGQKASISGKIKTCRVHDVLRELCVRMAHEENFLYVRTRNQDDFPKDVSFKRRLSIHDDATRDDSEEETTMQSMPFVRSFIYNGWDDTQLHSYYYFGYLLLRVLDMVEVELGRFPEEILQLVNLRYIAIACHAEIPGSIVVLWNLQTLMVIDPMGIASKLPYEIWSMPQLRHLKFSRVLLPCFHPTQPFTPQYNLHTFSGLEIFDLDILRRFQFLKKLGLHCNPLSFHSSLDIGFLYELETLKIFFDSPSDSTFLEHITLPLNLRKITLEGGSIAWDYMKVFGSLPLLEVLKLRGFAFRGQEWLPNEGEFLNLKFLLIWEADLVHWTAEDDHFPCLEHLILRNCSNLVEIPPGIGEISTLEIIEIDYSSPSAVDSAKQIQEDQRELGNDNLQVFIHPTKAKFYPLKFGIQQDESGRFYRRETKLESLKAEAASGSSSKS